MPGNEYNGGVVVSLVSLEINITEGGVNQHLEGC